ncbi:MAG: isoprenylcysteine carboxylmethyltransferase family protein [Pseudomonadota bacterium]|nr:isoprenylcysteine carboxylmethyltransferase family protein [Pseudomonadota bacterium]MEE3295580.1 isoprenylcysteine carboxylmethyltransferase family protein [Pseudomonadota bacterium]
MKLYPPHFLLISVIVMLAIWYVFSSSNPKNIFLMSTGWVLIVSGLTCNVIAANQFIKAKTSIIPLTESSFLVKKGIFRFSRNPMYTGMTIFLVGLGVILNNFYNIAVISGFFLLIRNKFVMKEEELLKETFGEEYLSYIKEVRRWI